MSVNAQRQPRLEEKKYMWLWMHSIYGCYNISIPYHSLAQEMSQCAPYLELHIQSINQSINHISMLVTNPATQDMWYSGSWFPGLVWTVWLLQFGGSWTKILRGRPGSMYTLQGSLTQICKWQIFVFPAKPLTRLTDGGKLIHAV